MRQKSWSIGVAPQVATSLGAGGVKLGIPVEKGWVGETRTPELRQRAERLVSGFAGTRRIVNEIEVREPEGFWSRRHDNTTTLRVKTAMLDLTSLPGFDPTRVNVTTAHQVVYLMGKVSREEDRAVVDIARDVSGVERVVKVFEYTD